VSQPISLTELANKYGSDKGNAVRFRHDYTALYDLIFAPPAAASHPAAGDRSGRR